MNRLAIYIFIVVLFSNCRDENPNPPFEDSFYRIEMRQFVIRLSEYSKAIKSTFVIIPQNGVELISKTGIASSGANSEYLNAIDGTGQEGLFYGYENLDLATPISINSYFKGFLNLSKNAGKAIFIIDYCANPLHITNSFEENNTLGFHSFAAEEKSLSTIPPLPLPLFQENNQTNTSLSQIKNFLFLINPKNFSTKNDFISAITATNYDLLVMDLFFHDGTEFTTSEINQLRNKANGSKRMLICYMSIGEAERYRYYWQTNWDNSPPIWLDAENPNWPGNYKVKYWEPDWQNIIFGNNESYLKKIINAGFDGVYLDLIDAFKFYE